MFSNYLASIEGVEIYPIFSLFVFFIFFIVVTYGVVKADKKYLDKMSSLPLDAGLVEYNNDFEK